MYNGLPPTVILATGTPFSLTPSNTLFVLPVNVVPSSPAKAPTLLPTILVANIRFLIVKLPDASLALPVEFAEFATSTNLPPVSL